MTEKDCNTCKHNNQVVMSATCSACMASAIFAEGWEAITSGALGTQVAGSHYKDFVIQPIEFAMQNGLNACQAKVVKYVCRKKGDLKKQLEDLDKAIHVIELYKQLLNDGKVK